MSKVKINRITCQYVDTQETDTMILTGRYLDKNSESPERDMIRDMEDINGKN